jgi:aerobic carbon-monoxide dehydrogenase large subunit
MVMSKMVGARVRRKEDPRLITGSSTYVDDVQLPGTLHAVIVRSSYPHGIIQGYDTAEARALPGIVEIVTGDDLERLFKVIGTEAKGETTQEQDDVDDIPVPDVYPLARGKVRYIGEPLAVVVAETRASGYRHRRVRRHGRRRAAAL